MIAQREASTDKISASTNLLVDIGALLIGAYSVCTTANKLSYRRYCALQDLAS
jgi:hypothetical protein